MIELYSNIKKRRLALGLTQQSLAELLGYADKSMIAKIEKGVVDLPQSKIVDFSIALKTTPAWLMGWEEDQPDQKAELIDEAIEEYMKLSDEGKKKASAFIRFLLSQKESQ